MSDFVGNGRDGLCLATHQHKENRKPFRFEIVSVQTVYIGSICCEAVCKQSQSAAYCHLTCFVEKIHNSYMLCKT